ncbi:MAG: type I glyceraldehyde-3-phosphate dehydrogenase [Desulfarculaceae bacterium]|nr:type I glyceraldehyde-3-phosphate dehydrogenase [Desulfarculaceae bacterium]MCF8072315.1 type I glyceraldehyde-3-phosphate dehydrogenase [Desulfarculaceae bacterium]MCF8100236.1 type I glyceraldehyde-3-phosphate dehydrogenase [Desulfarculaceae bacterium]MCF8116191.1 type I glyceraldehyde-3-phosphate dehydrogenase [Desulfarculaceae bacterium]
MAVTVGINGFGRIGRLATRILGKGHPELDLVAINARADTAQLAHLLKYDSVHRTYDAEVGYEGDDLLIDGKRVAITREPAPDQCSWGPEKADLVLETTGKFKTKKECGGHLEAGAERVVMGAPGKDPDITIVMGVNDQLYDPARHIIVSNASCTTNCLAPVVKVLNDSFGIEHGLLTTTHAYTMSQRILDGSSKDIRRARAAAMSMIPTTTGAAKAVTLVIPEMDGKLDGFAIRVPTPDVSLVDLTCRLGKDVSVEDVNQALSEAAEGPMKGYLHVTEVPLVSIDYTGCPYSSVVDAPLTQVIGGRMVKVLAWYDNEMGYAARLVDLAALVASKM